MATLVRFWTRLLAWGGVSTVVDIVCSAAWDGFSLWLFDVRMRLTLRQLVRLPSWYILWSSDIKATILK